MNTSRHIEKAATLLAACGFCELADKIRQREDMLQRELDRRATEAAKLRARIAELERQAASGVTLINEGNIANHVPGATKMATDRQLADAVNELRDIAIKYHAADQLRERIAGVVHGLVRGEPVAVAVDAGALDRLRVTVDAYDKAWADDMPQRQKIAALQMAEAARRLLAGGE